MPAIPQGFARRFPQEICSLFDHVGRFGITKRFAMKAAFQGEPSVRWRSTDCMETAAANRARLLEATEELSREKFEEGS